MTKDVRRTGASEERGKKEWPRSGGGGGGREGGLSREGRNEVGRFFNLPGMKIFPNLFLVGGIQICQSESPDLTVLEPRTIHPP